MSKYYTKTLLDSLETDSNGTIKEFHLEIFFNTFDIHDPTCLDALDLVIDKIGDINKIINKSNLLLMACYRFQLDLINLLLTKGADPNVVLFKVTPLSFLFSRYVNSYLKESEMNKVKENILISLLRHGMSISYKGEKHSNILDYAKSNGNLSLLQSIEKHTDVLNENQKKEWERLRLNMLFL